MSLENRIGVSTLWMPDNGESLWEAIDQAYDAGFRSIEVVPAQWEGGSGIPTRPSLGLDMDRFDVADRERLRQSLSRFDYRLIHSLSRDVNIASRNPGVARESVRQYMQCAQLAVDTGCSMVTYHPGIAKPTDQMSDDAFVIEANIAFGKQLAEFAERHDLRAGFENLGGWPTPDQMQQVLDGIGSDRVGLHFDVGHSWLVEPRDPYAWLPRFADRLVAVHMHGTYHRPDRGYENHQSLELDDGTDLPRLMGLLREAEYEGPINFEILARNMADYLAACQRSKGIVLAL